MAGKRCPPLSAVRTRRRHPRSRRAAGKIAPTRGRSAIETFSGQRREITRDRFRGERPARLEELAPRSKLHQQPVDLGKLRFDA